MKVLLLLSLNLFLVTAADFSADFFSSQRLLSADIYNELLANADPNFLFSPFSLETIMALTQSGGIEATSEEIRSALRLPNTEEQTEALMLTILPMLQSENFTIHSANRIYIEENFLVREEFQKVAREVYKSDIENVEFLQNVDAAGKINRWVEENTGGKVRDLVTPGDLDENTRLVLINALTFSATWLYPFDTLNTQKRDFHLSEDESVSADTMFLFSFKHKFYENPELDATFLELPFQGDASMTFVLPSQKDGLSSLERQREKVLAAQPYTVERVMVSLPKFRIETSVDFNDILQNLGVVEAFDPLRADFSGMAGEKGDLYVQKVKQKAFVSVDESGVDAAAATSVDVDVLAMTKNFLADHPFMFYIKVKDVVLFEGRVVEPEY